MKNSLKKYIVLVAIITFSLFVYKLPVSNDSNLKNEQVVIAEKEELTTDTNSEINKETNSKNSIITLRNNYQNNDIIAILKIENTDLESIVVKTTDNDYYLTHSFEKEEIKCGSIFMEAENASDFSDDNTFIYGHNMKDKSMFAKLNQFKDEQIYKENPEFLIYTENAIYRYSIFSCYVADISWDSFNYQFATEDAYGGWLQTVKNRSIYDTGVTPQKDQKTVTLMTCTPSGENYRFLVHGALAEVIQPKEK